MPVVTVQNWLIAIPLCILAKAMISTAIHKGTGARLKGIDLSQHCYSAGQYTIS